MKILSSFTHSQAVPNYYYFLFFGWIQNIFGNNSWWSPLTSTVFSPFYERQWGPSTICSATFFKISSFIFHQLALAAKFKVPMLAYKTTTDTAPIYLNSLVQTYAALRSLRSLQVIDALWCHHKEAQNHSHRTFPGLFPAGGTTCLYQSEQLNL